MPTVSILLPVYNAVKDLPRAIHSLLNQTFLDFEVIAIDDGSNDGSSEMLDTFSQKDARIRVFHQSNAGALGITLNKALEHAQGQYIARQDADDASHPTRLENQVRYLGSHPQIGLCGSWTWFIDSGLGPLFSLELPDNHKLLMGYLNKGMNPFVHGSIMGRTDQFRKIGGYRGSYAEDFDLWLRLGEITRLGTCTSLGYYFWRSSGGISHGAYSSQVGLTQLYLKLKNERIRFGKEILSWKDEYLKIISTPKTETSPNERELSMHYSRAIQLLRSGVFKEARDEFTLAAPGDGIYSQKARRNLAFFGFAPIIAAFYHLFETQEPFHYSRRLPKGTKLPSGIINPEIQPLGYNSPFTNNKKGF